MIIQVVLFSIALYLCPIIGGGFGELGNALVQIPIFLAFAFWLIKDNKAISKLRNTNLVFLFASFIVVIIISAFFTCSIYLSIKQLIYWLACILAYFLAAQLSNEKRFVRSLALSISLAAFTVSLYGIRYYALSSGGGAAFWNALSGSGDHMRLFGTFVNPSFFAGFLVLSIPITFAVFLSSRKLLPIVVSTFSLACQFIAILLTGTKFGVLAALIAILMLIILGFTARVFRKAEFLRILIVLVLMLPLGYMFAKPVTSRVAKAQTGGADVHSANFRLYAWKSSLDILKAHPMIGTGPGTYELIYPKYAIAGATKHAHQGYLQIADESGLPASLVFLACLAGTAFIGLKRVWSLRKEPPAAKEFIESSMVTFDDFIPNSKLWIIYIAFISACAGSLIRNLVDPDWFIAGIGITFFCLLGLIAGSNYKSIYEFRYSAIFGKLKAAFCFIMIITSISLAGGDYYLSKASQNSEPSVLLEKAEKISPWNPKVLIALGRIYGSDSKYYDEAAFFSKADYSIYQSRAYSCLDTGNIKDAVDYFTEALKYHPKSTSMMLMLSDIYKQLGETKKQEEYLNKILALENTPYEQVKGVPELVDTSYAYAHFYFGNKYMHDKNYKKAIVEFEASAKRLENWRSYESYLAIERASGRLSSEKENQNLQLLKDSYKALTSIRIK